jgi:hypothetical protein
MNRHVSDCLVTGYEALIPTLTLPNPDDRHVLEAAIHGQAEMIETYNLGDFPASVLVGYGIEAVHPDEFIARLWDEQPDSVLTASRLHRASLREPPKAAAEYLTTLEQCRLIETVARLRPHEDKL